ncbi:CU044_5270 family protein [Xylanimonas protaetiae]|uniref:Uncharacterized protein n=1 Tax=Xylanimonas protaetiae TaxID=2509457 RepID=A0A4P6F3N0_9MICO|nr:CU044_5270 family protein [Xylanimonas protaetiae]QAY69845.1 hypothetical protein ET471_07160 [Xylanimonas protaetiae]
MLLQAADAAALQPQATGEYWYVHWQITDHFERKPGSGEFVPITYQREDWSSRERGVMRDEQGAAFKAVEDGRTTIDPADVRFENYTIDDTGTPAARTFSGFTWDELDALPTDPVQLRAALLAATPSSGHGRNYDLFDSVQWLLFGSPARPELRRALWTVLAGIDEVTLLGGRTDALGRQGTAVEVKFPDWYVTTMTLDPTTGMLLEWRATEQDGSRPLTYTLVEQGPRDSAPAAQPPLCGPGSVPLVSC